MQILYEPFGAFHPLYEMLFVFRRLLAVTILNLRIGLAIVWIDTDSVGFELRHIYFIPELGTPDNHIGANGRFGVARTVNPRAGETGWPERD